MSQPANITTVKDGMGPVQRGLKRALDTVSAALGLVILSPVFLVIALLMKRQHNGPVIFRQVRIGYGGKPFVMYKFRTLSSEIEEKGPQLVAKCDDSNSTKLEQFLRSNHIDELPQLWNVLKGDMAFVGPRPERKFFIDQIIANDPRYPQLYAMRPGLTSDATLYNGYTDTMEKMLKRLEMDLDYYRRRSLVLDFKIITKTVLSILTGRKI